ncbi:hypothetical protein ACLB2K_006418 [Fragaria x ananassa]
MTSISTKITKIALVNPFTLSLSLSLPPLFIHPTTSNGPRRQPLLLPWPSSPLRLHLLLTTSSTTLTGPPTTRSAPSSSPVFTIGASGRNSWVSNKSSFSSLRSGDDDGFERERKVKFASNGGGADSESWGRKMEESNGGGGFERERKVGLGFNSNGGCADAESWGRRREESNGGTESTGWPRLNLHREAEAEL